MKLVLIRHGEPAWTDENGNSNLYPPLSELGFEQAEKLGEYWAELLEDTTLFASPLLRAQQTIAPLAARLGKEVTTLDWLEEIRLPERWHGQPSQIMGEDFVTFGMQSRELWFHGQRDGEACSDFNNRIKTGLEAFLNSHNVCRSTDEPDHIWDTPDTWDNDRTFVLTAHVGTIGVVLSHLLPAVEEPWEWERFALGHSGVAVIQTKALSTGHIWQLTRFNDRNHLGKQAV